MEETIRVTIIRGDHRNREKARTFYEIKSREPITLLKALLEIYKNTDATLAFRTHQCYRGTCGSCSVSFNGRTVRACKKLIYPGMRVEIGPIPNFELIRDLVVDFSKKDNHRGDIQ